MKQLILSFIIAACFIMNLSSCSVTKGVKSNVILPEGTTTEVAEQIINKIWKDDFLIKITSKYPHFNPALKPKEQGISLTWLKFSPADKSEKGTLSIHIEIKYKGSLDNADQIADYAKSIVQTQVNEFFNNQ